MIIYVWFCELICVLVIFFIFFGKKFVIMVVGLILEDEYWDSIIFFLIFLSKIDSKWIIVDIKVCYVVVF